VHGQVEACARGELPRPDAGREDDTARRDPALLGLDGHDAPALDGNPLHGATLDDGRAEPRHRRGVALDGGLGSRVAVERAERGGEEVVRAEPRDDAARLLGREQARGDAELLLKREGAAEGGDLLLARQQEEVAPLLEADLAARLLGEALVAADALERDPDVQLVRELGADAAGGLARGARAEGLPLDEDAAGGARARQVVEGARAHDAAADDDHLCRGRETHQ